MSVTSRARLRGYLLAAPVMKGREPETKRTASPPWLCLSPSNLNFARPKWFTALLINAISSPGTAASVFVQSENELTPKTLICAVVFFAKANNQTGNPSARISTDTGEPILMNPASVIRGPVPLEVKTPSPSIEASGELFPSPPAGSKQQSSCGFEVCVTSDITPPSIFLFPT